MDKDARLALVGIAGIPQVKMQDASEAWRVSPQICEQPWKAQVPGFLEAYESGEDNLLKEPSGAKHKLSRFVDAGVQRLRRARAW
jgi:hypothetical protein